MFIQTEKTPNPETVKFLPGINVMQKGVADYKTVADAADSPLAQRLFLLEGVRAVFLGRDFVSVTKDETAQWEQMKPRVLAAIMDHFTAGLPVVNLPAETVSANESLSEIEIQILDILKTRVQPAVASDGGHIEFVRFEDGIAYLHMQGACSGCPSSAVTLKSGIENLLRHYIPEVVAVEAVSDEEYYS